MKTRRARPVRPLNLLVLVAASMISVASLAQVDARLAALEAAEIARFEANVDANAEALEKLLDRDLSYTHSNGDLDTKTSFIKSLIDGTRDYLSTEPAIDSIRIYGDVAIVRGTAQVSVATKGGEPRALSLSYTDVWLWKGGRWQMTEWRSTRLPETAAAAK